KGRRGNAEDNVIRRQRCTEIRLWQSASAGIGTTGNREHIFHPAIGRVGVDASVVIEKEREPHFEGGPISSNEGWDGVAGRGPVAHKLELRIDGGARPANRRLCVTRAALIRVKARSQTIVAVGALGNGLHRLESGKPIIEKSQD